MGVDSVGGVKNEGFPLTKPVAVNTRLCNCTACDLHTYYSNILLIIIAASLLVYSFCKNTNALHLCSLIEFGITGYYDAG